MTVRGHIAGLWAAAAALSLAVASPALAGPAGDEYLPKVPQSGAHPSGGGSGGGGSGGGSGGSVGVEDTGTTTLPTGDTSSGSGNEAKKSDSSGKDEKSKKKVDQITPIGSTGSGDSDGGDSSGSILFNPIVLLMIAAVIAAAIGMTLRRRQADGGDAESPEASSSGSEADARRESEPRTPDGEIVTGRDGIA